MNSFYSLAYVPPHGGDVLELDALLEEPRQAYGAGFLALYFDELFSKPEGRKQLASDLRTFVELRRVPPEC